MQTNNNPFAEIGVILIALGFIAAGTTLLALGKIDLNVAMTLYVLAASVAGINVALKAPSPTQQQLLAQALQAQAQPAQLVQAPAPVGQVPLAELRLQPGQTVQMPFPANTTAIQPMPQAIMTTQNMPAVPKS